MKRISKAYIKSFQKEIYSYYRSHAREFPWRKTTDPYRILLSEVMLQQTQAGARTVCKYESFLKRFPTVGALSRATVRDVFSEWQGLGYNRRAKALREAAVRIVREHRSRIPRTARELVALPGVGAYTAGAILAFAYHKPIVVVETNIRTVYIHFFFKRHKGDINDRELFPLIEATLDHANVREWYYALMDYGAMLKKIGRSGNAKSKHYTKQKPFEGSDRQIRGEIMALLLAYPSLTPEEIAAKLKRDMDRVQRELVRLSAEGMIVKMRTRYKL